ncbi:hypothetical protein D9O36_02845 [Zobellia amurskyensis]|uniref:Uncharacterized protein n=1 Tax=Zobellia amurskyensis TaxID=248905 RepID=A0A7X2ZR03_9FLAO|nr:hypothetical protein [Zobellia amurskyensis]MUH34769.1 hypothetical protein [Zobellia amurskyensis]
MRKIILASVVCLFYNLLEAQETIIFKVDLAKKELEHVATDDLKTNQFYDLKITGINTAFVDVIIETTDFGLSSSTPDILKSLLLKIPDSGIFGFISQESTAPKYGLIYAQSMEHIEKLQALTEIATLLYNESNDNAEFRTLDMVKSIQKKAQLHLRELDQIFKNNPDILKPKETNLDVLRNSVAQSYQYIQSAKNYYKTLIENSDLTIDSSVANELIIYASNLEVLSENINLETSLRYFDFLVKSMEMKNYEQFPELLRASKDVLETKITLINTFTNDTIFTKKIDFFTKKGGFKFDFSTGFFYNNLNEKSYYLEDNGDGRNQILEENGSNFDVSIGALAHYSYQFSAGLRGGLNAGAAVSPLDGITRYLFGAGVLIGREQLIGVNVGASLARIDVLSNSVENENGNLYVPVEYTSAPTYKKSEWGIYLGLTYNLTRERKK